MKLPLYCLAVLVCLPLTAQAAMYKCKLPNGTSTFQDTPCGNGSVGTVANVSKMQYVSGYDPSADGADPANSAALTPVNNMYGNQSGQQDQNGQVIVRKITPIHVWVAPASPAPSPAHVEHSSSGSSSHGSQPSHGSVQR